MGALLNGISDKDFRQYMPEDWDATLQAVGEVNGAIGELDSEITSITAQLNHMKSSNMYADTSTQSAQDYERRRKEAIAGMATAKAVFNRGKQQIENIEDLMSKLDSGSNDEKAAIDLSSRMTAEVAILNAQSLQMQAVTAKQMSEMNNYWNELDAKEALMSQDFNKNDFPW